MARLFFAGFEHGHDPRFRRLVDGLDIKDVLVTFEHSGKFPPRKQRDFYSWATEKNLSVMVDSGVFSLYRRGIDRIGLMQHYEAYSVYLHRHAGKYEFAINLDADRLPGFGSAWSDDFYTRFVRQGLTNVLPVWHFAGEGAFDRLDRLATKYERIAIGVNGMRTKKGTKNDEPFKTRMDYIYSRYTDNKFHLLGLTDPAILTNYPVYSGDSSTWIQKAKYGDVVYWDANRAKVCYTHSRQLEKVRRCLTKFAGHDFSLTRAMNLSGTGIESMLERGKLALQAFIFMRDFINRLWETKNVKTTKESKESSTAEN